MKPSEIKLALTVTVNARVTDQMRESFSDFMVTQSEVWVEANIDPLDSIESEVT